MRVLLVHPSALMYSEIFLRLEPLGLERVAAAVLADGHEVRLIDLQVHDRGELERQLAEMSAELLRRPEMAARRLREGGEFIRFLSRRARTPAAP